MTSGIYNIRNKINDNCYIGSSINIESRFNIHKSALKNNKHHSSYLQNSFNKHGIENFEFEIVEYVKDKNKLLEREQVWMDFFKPKYNVNKFSNSRLGSKASEETIKKMRASAIRLGIKPPSFKGKKHSIETKGRMSKIQLGTKRSKETCFNISKSKRGKNHPFYGTKFSEEHKRKISESNSGNKNHMYGKVGNKHHLFGKTPSEETRRKISESNKGKKHTEEWKLKMSKIMKGRFNTGQFIKGHTLHNKAVLQFDKNDKFIKRHSSIKDAKKELKIDNISYVCSGNRNFAGGFKWKFEDISK